MVADGVTLTDTQKANILSAIKVTDSTSTALNSISKSWENGKIVLSFSENLTASSTYTISCGDIEGVNLTCTVLSFTTICFSGSGTRDDPFLVATAEQLNMVRKYLSCYFKQTEDISLASFANWEPIGKDNNNLFEGSYDGDNKKITKLTINDQQLDYYGLFGYCSRVGIYNIAAEEFSINVDNAYVGGICGFNATSINFCSVASSTINGQDNVGGISGKNGSSINYCSVASSTINGKDWVGGISGYGSAGIHTCYVASSTINGQDYVGGISGYSVDSIISCYVASSAITLTTTSGNIGGICGGFSVRDNDSKISSCFVYLESLNKMRNINNTHCGGLIVGVKVSSGTIKDCFTNLTGDLKNSGYDLSDTCYDGVSTYDIFKTKTWSDGKTYEGGSNVWSEYKPISGSSWPPDLTENPRPQP